MRVIQKILLLGFLLLPVQVVWAIDADLDGSDSAEEVLAGTSDSDSTQRPYWWKTFNGDISNDRFGQAVSGAGDVNNDGYADFIVGAWWHDFARVFSGQDGSILFTFDGSPGLGKSVSGAGDVNDDGFGDVIVGSGGSVFVYSGLDGSVLYTFNGEGIPGDFFGQSVSGAGDVNGDGYADMIVGASSGGVVTQPGYARVFSGVDGSILYAFNGDNAGDAFGVSVSGAGDVNADGYDDVIAGARLASTSNGDGTGSARVFSGKDGSILYTFDGDGCCYDFGESVSGAGDVNGDGHADLIVGATNFTRNYNGTGAGYARVFSGKNGSVLHTFNGEIGDYFGYSVSGAGDVSGDGHSDLIVGAWARSTANSSSGLGYARVFSGEDGSTLYTFNGDNDEDLFGHSVSGAGDVDGDGLGDLIVGAYGDDNNGDISGSARVFLSTNLLNDVDLDYQVNPADNCPPEYNPLQEDADGDGIGDPCDIEAHTPQGSYIQVGFFEDATITFEYVATQGSTSVELTSEPPVGSPTSTAFEVNGYYFDVNTTAQFFGAVELCFTYDGSSLTIDEEKNLKLMHFNETTMLWEDNTLLPVDTANNKICGTTFQFSVFAVGLPYDRDGDGICDKNIDVESICVAGPAGGDNCRSISNPLQEDADDDGCGDLCEIPGCGGVGCIN